MFGNVGFDKSFKQGGKEILLLFNMVMNYPMRPADKNMGIHCNRDHLTDSTG